MGQIFQYTASSKEASWLISLTIAGKKNRIDVCLNKITRLYYQSRLGIVPSILFLYRIYTDIRQVEGYFDKEIARLTKLIKHKVKDKIEYTPYNGKTHRLRITNPISASFYRLLLKYDTLNCLSETCMVLSIFKRRRVFHGKLGRYKQSLMHIITKLSQCKLDGISSIIKLSDDQKDDLAIALQSDVMPILSKDLFRTLKKLSSDKKTNEKTTLTIKGDI